MKNYLICALALLSIAGLAWGQDSSGQDANSQQNTPPPAAFGQEGSPVVINDNPTIS